MQNNIYKDFYNVGDNAVLQFSIRSGLFILISFAILRPLTLMGKNIGIYEINLLEIFGIGISYLFLLPLFCGLRLFILDRVNILILAFSFYCLQSLIWGSEIRMVTIAVLPFLAFFSVRIFIKESKLLKILLIAIYFGFFIPTAWSTFNIATGRNIPVVEFWNQLPRHAGAFGGSHTLAYTMILISFFFCILFQIYPIKNNYFKFITFIFLLNSFYCLFQSNTRTAIIGFMIFWFVYLFGKNKILFFGFIIVTIFLAIVFQAHIKSLIWKTPEEHNLERATSGRVSMLKNNLKLFIDSDLTKKLVGYGLSEKSTYGYHNDFMRILISLGLLGITLYLILLFYVFFDIFLCQDKMIKYLFGAIIISVTAMNFGSNGFIFRFELSQYYWLIIGIFYNINELRINEKEKY